jgi:hypothetical protein
MSAGTGARTETGARTNKTATQVASTRVAEESYWTGIEYEEH